MTPRPRQAGKSRVASRIGGFRDTDEKLRGRQVERGELRRYYRDPCGCEVLTIWRWRKDGATRQWFPTMLNFQPGLFCRDSLACKDSLELDDEPLTSEPTRGESRPGGGSSSQDPPARSEQDLPDLPF